MQQRPYRKCDSGGQSVAYEHDTPFIPPVADHAGKNAQQHIRRIGTHRQKRGGQRGAVLLIRPDDQAEAGHGAAERGKRLGAPKQQERTQTVENFYLFHFGFAPFYREKSSDKNAKPDADSNVSSMRRVRRQTLHGAAAMQSRIRVSLLICRSASCTAGSDRGGACLSYTRHSSWQSHGSRSTCSGSYSCASVQPIAR